MDLCLGQGLPRIVCENVLFLLGGYDIKQMNEAGMIFFLLLTGGIISSLRLFPESLEYGQLKKYALKWFMWNDI